MKKIVHTAVGDATEMVMSNGPLFFSHAIVGADMSKRDLGLSVSAFRL